METEEGGKTVEGERQERKGNKSILGQPVDAIIRHGDHRCFLTVYTRSSQRRHQPLLPWQPQICICSYETVAVFWFEVNKGRTFLVFQVWSEWRRPDEASLTQTILTITTTVTIVSHCSICNVLFSIFAQKEREKQLLNQSQVTLPFKRLQGVGWLMFLSFCCSRLYSIFNLL